MAAPRSTARPLIPALMAAGLSAALVAGILLDAAGAAVSAPLAGATGALGLVGLALTAAALATGQSVVVGWGIALLAAGYAVSLVGRGGSLDAAAPLVGLALVLVAELSHTACEWRGPHAVHAFVERRRWLRVVAVAGGEPRPAGERWPWPERCRARCRG